MSEPSLPTSVPLPPAAPGISQNLHTTLVGAFSRTMDMYVKEHPEVLQSSPQKKTSEEVEDEWSPNYMSKGPEAMKGKQAATKAKSQINK